MGPSVPRDVGSLSAMRSLRRASLAALGLATAIGLVACAGASGPPTPFPSLGANTVVLTAKGTAFTTQDVHAPANLPWTLALDNQDNLPHNVVIVNASNTTVFTGAIVNGPKLATEPGPVVVSGTYRIMCAIHPEMHGTLTVP